MHKYLKRFSIATLSILLFFNHTFSQEKKSRCESSYIDILYGIVYQPQSYNAVNDPYYINDFLPATLYFNDKCIDDALIKYDIYNQELVLYQDYDVRKSRFIKLNANLINRLELVDKQGNAHKFISSKEIPLTNQDIIFYEEVYIHKIKYYIGNKKRLNEFVQGNKNKFSLDEYHYLYVDNRLFEFSNRKELYGILNMDKKEIKRFVRKNKLKIKMDRIDDIIKLLQFFEERFN